MISRSVEFIKRNLQNLYIQVKNKAKIEKAVKTPPKKKPSVKKAKAARTSLKARAKRK